MNLYHYITPATTACEKRIELSKIKMGKNYPARDLQRRSHGGLVLTCLTLVAFCVTSTSGLDQVQGTASTQPSPALPGMNMTGQFSRFVQPATPPTTGTYLMECSGYSYDHCWLDDNTMVFVDLGKVIKVTVNRGTKSCTYFELGSEPQASRAACSPEGKEIYVTDIERSYLWVYDRNGLKALWTPEGLVGTPYTVAINSQIIMVGTTGRGPVYMYNRNRVYLGQIKILQNQYRFDFTHLTEEGLFLATSVNGHRLIIHDIAKGSTVSVGGQGSDNGQFNRPLGLSAIGEYIVVCDETNKRLPIFHKNGQFQTNLQLKGGVMTNFWSIDYRSGPNIMSVSSSGGVKIKLYTLN